jgi:hypothetical protein
MWQHGKIMAKAANGIGKAKAIWRLKININKCNQWRNQSGVMAEKENNRNRRNGENNRQRKYQYQHRVKQINNGSNNVSMK